MNDGPPLLNESVDLAAYAATITTTVIASNVEILWATLRISAAGSDACYNASR